MEWTQFLTLSSTVQAEAEMDAFMLNPETVPAYMLNNAGVLPLGAHVPGTSQTIATARSNLRRTYPAGAAVTDATVDPTGVFQLDVAGATLGRVMGAVFNVVLGGQTNPGDHASMMCAMMWNPTRANGQWWEHGGDNSSTIAVIFRLLLWADPTMIRSTSFHSITSPTPMEERGIVLSSWPPR